MANYNLVVNSTFTPFTYEQYLAPFKEYKQAYETTEKAYSDLLTSAGAYEDIVQNSPEAKFMYDTYYKDLQQQADSLSRGLNVNNRRALMGLKSRFAKEITPIDRAYKEVQAANELRAKAGPDAIYQSNVYNIDDALHGKQLNNTYQSKSALTKKTATMIQSAIQQRLQDPEFSKKFNDMYIAITQHTGGSYEDLQEALRQTLGSDPIADNMFSSIREQVASDAGYNEHDNIGKQQIEAAINEGLYYGLDNPKVSLQQNPDWMSNLQKQELNLRYANQRLAQEEFEAKMAASGMEKKDGKWVPISSSTTGSDSKVGSQRVNVIDKPLFIDIKNPEKSHILSEGESPTGEVVSYKYLEALSEQGKESHYLNKLAREKYSKNQEVKNYFSVLDTELKNLFNNTDLSEDEVKDIINHHVIQVDKNGNIYISPKKQQYPTSVGGSVVDSKNMEGEE